MKWQKNKGMGKKKGRRKVIAKDCTLSRIKIV